MGRSATGAASELLRSTSGGCAAEQIRQPSISLRSSLGSDFAQGRAGGDDLRIDEDVNERWKAGGKRALKGGREILGRPNRLAVGAVQTAPAPRSRDW